MKEKILAFLVTKIPGTQKAFLEGIADNYATTITEESQIETIISDGVISALKSSFDYVQKEGDRRATEATQNSISNYEKKHGLKDGKKVEVQIDPPRTEPKEDTPEWAKALIDQNKKINEELAVLKGEKVSETRKTQLINALEKAPSHYKERIEKDFGRMNFENEEEFSSWISEVSTESETLSEELKAKGSIFGVPRGGGKTDTEEVPAGILEKFENKPKEGQNF